MSLGWAITFIIFLIANSFYFYFLGFKLGLDKNLVEEFREELDAARKKAEVNWELIYEETKFLTGYSQGTTDSLDALGDRGYIQSPEEKTELYYEILRNLNKETTETYDEER